VPEQCQRVTNYDVYIENAAPLPPNSTRVWNFINNFRQATCQTQNHLRTRGVVTTGGWSKAPQGSTSTGGYAQCCTSCSVQDDCVSWTYERGRCTLFSSVTSREPCPVDEEETFQSCVSGSRGGYEKWTTLPQNFRDHGYFTLGVGKYFHDGGGGRGGAPGDEEHPGGPGQPPTADAHLSWSQGPVQFPDLSRYQRKYGAFSNPYGNGKNAYLAAIDNGVCTSMPHNSTDYCTPDTPLDGSGAKTPFCDFITYIDARRKLQFAAENRRQNGQPFFMIVGVRRPHLNWYVPASYAELYPRENVSLPRQRTLDASIDPVAYTLYPMDAPREADGGKSSNFVKSPFTSGSDNQLRELRRHYYAAVSWADYVTGQVLEELERQGLADDTLVVMHADHGWHLGEYAMWEKRSLWELGTRVPFMMRVPWLGERARGRHSKALVEVVDVYRTLCDLMGVPLPDDDVPLDGVSLRPLLEDPSLGKVKDVALSVHPRCKHAGMPVYGSRGLPGGADNSCLNVERTDFTWMGYTMRTDRYRYTEFVRWNGTTLSPEWSQLRAHELYDHARDLGRWTDPDDFENVNLAPSADPELLAQLSKQLHAAFGYPSDEFVPLAPAEVVVL